MAFRGDMLGEFYERPGSHTDGDADEWIDVCRLERSGRMPGNGYMHCDSERSCNSDRHIQQRDFSGYDWACSGKSFDREYNARE